LRINRVEFKNFKCFPDLILPEKDGERFPEGLFLIQGKTPEKSNSYGKTSFVEGILFGLFGPKSTNFTINDLITFLKEKGDIKIIFEINGIEYMVHRILIRNKKSGSQKLNTYIKINSVWKPDNTIKIEDLLEIKREQALETVFVKQGQIESLASASPAKLRDLIIELFRLNIVDYALEYLKKIKREEVERIKEINRIFIPLEEIERNLNKKRTQLDENLVEIKNNQDNVKELQKKLRELPDKERITGIKELKQSVEKILSKIEIFSEELKNKSKYLEIKANTEQTDIEELIKVKENEINAANNALKATSEELKNIISEINKKQGIISQIQKSIEKIEKNFKFDDGKKIAKCPTCTREISFDNAQEIIKHYDNEIFSFKNDIEKSKPNLSDLEKKKQELESNLDDINSKFRALQDFKENLIKKKNYEEEIKKHQKNYLNLLKEFNISTEQEFLDKFSIANIDQLGEIINKSESDIHTLLQLNDRIRKENLKLQKDLQELEQKKNENIKLGQERDNLEVKINHIEKNKDLVKGFITEYMVEKRLITNIQYTTKRFLSHFTGGQYSNINLTSIDRGRGIRIDVYDEFNRILKEIDFLSGGDKVALGFALRMGISELMTKIRPTKDSPKRNPKIDFMILDEPLAALDESRRKQVLASLESQKDFKQIFLITHTKIPEEISPNLIKISKDIKNGLSTAVFENKDKKNNPN